MPAIRTTSQVGPTLRLPDPLSLRSIDKPMNFLTKLYYAVQETSRSSDTMYWSADGTQLVVANPKALERYILPVYYKHSNFASFGRQLNIYGFSRVYPGRQFEDCDGNIASDASVWSHPSLHRDSTEEDLAQIKRRAPRKAQRSLPSASVGLQSNHNAQTQLSASESFMLFQQPQYSQANRGSDPHTQWFQTFLEESEENREGFDITVPFDAVDAIALHTDRQNYGVLWQSSPTDERPSTGTSGGVSHLDSFLQPQAVPTPRDLIQAMADSPAWASAQSMTISNSDNKYDGDYAADPEVGELPGHQASNKWRQPMTEETIRCLPQGSHSFLQHDQESPDISPSYMAAWEIPFGVTAQSVQPGLPLRPLAVPNQVSRPLPVTDVWRADTSVTIPSHLPYGVYLPSGL